MKQEIREAITSAAQILGTLFLQDPKEAEMLPLLDELKRFSSFDDWSFGSAKLLDEAYVLMREGFASPQSDLAREYQRLFIGPQHFSAPAWGSVYLDRESVLFGSSTLDLRQWLRDNGILVYQERQNSREPEDHIGKMLLLLGWLALEKPELIPLYLSEHLMPWAPRFLELLEADAREPLYRGLAILTKTTLEGIVEALDIVVVKKRLYR